MNQSDMSKVMDRILKEVAIMRDAGQSEYSHDNSDVFANFNRVSNLLDVDRKKVLMTYMLKHVDGIAAYVKGHESQREDVTGRITDCVVYLMLLWAMIEEEDGIVHREEGNPSMHNVWDKLKAEDGSILDDKRRVLDDRVHSESDLSQMRKAGDRIKRKIEEAGEPT